MQDDLAHLFEFQSPATYYAFHAALSGGTSVESVAAQHGVSIKAAQYVKNQIAGRDDKAEHEHLEVERDQFMAWLDQNKVDGESSLAAHERFKSARE